MSIDDAQAAIAELSAGGFLDVRPDPGGTRIAYRLTMPNGDVVALPEEGGAACSTV